MNIPLFRPDVGPDEADAVAAVLSSRWTGLGPEVEAFEHEFAEAVGAKYAVALNSGTSALEWTQEAGRCIGRDLHLSIPAMTWPGLYHIGDITGDIDEYGNGTHANNVTNHAGLHAGNVGDIDDCAHLGPVKRPWRTLVQCWSFHSVKCLSCGDGGMMTTNSVDLANHCRKWRWFGIDADTHKRNKARYKWQYDIVQAGGKHHMNDITAAIGRVQLARWQDMLDRRLDMRARCYQKAQIRGDHLVIYLAQDKQHRTEIMERLDASGISYGMHYRPVWEFKNFRYLVKPEHFPNSSRWSDTAISLPYGSSFTQQEQEYIAKVMEDVL